MRYKGHTINKTYIPNKPYKWGLLLRAACTAKTGFCVNMFLAIILNNAFVLYKRDHYGYGDSFRKFCKCIVLQLQAKFFPTIKQIVVAAKPTIASVFANHKLT